MKYRDMESSSVPTSLIKEFCNGKKAIYFMVREINDNANLLNFSGSMEKLL